MRKKKSTSESARRKSQRHLPTKPSEIKTNMPTQEKGKISEKKVRLLRTYPEDLKSNFVVHLVVQHQIDSFILSFFEVWPPVVLGETDEDKQAALDSLESVEAKCVARLVVTPNKMREFLAVMNTNLLNYEKLMTVWSAEKED